MKPAWPAPAGFFVPETFSVPLPAAGVRARGHFALETTVNSVHKKLLTVHDMMKLYGIGRSTIFAEIASGRLKSSLIFNRRYIRPGDAEAWCDARMAEGATARRTASC